MPLVLEDIVRVTIVGHPSSINLSANLFWKATDATETIYVKLVKAKSEINRLLGVPMLAKGADKKQLQHTSIIETLTQIRNDHISSMIEAAKGKEDKVDLDIDDGKQPGLVKRRRAVDEFMKDLPETVEIDCPAVGPIDSIKMKVRVDKQSTPLFVELTSKSIDYLMSVVKEQISAGDIHRRARRDEIDPGEKVVVPDGFSWSYKRKRLVQKKLVFSPTSQKKRSRPHTTRRSAITTFSKMHIMTMVLPLVMSTIVEPMSPLLLSAMERAFPPMTALMNRLMSLLRRERSRRSSITRLAF